MSADDFDWDEAQEDGAVVQNSALQVAVYTNASGDIAIRRELPWDEDSDTRAWIVIARGKMPTFIAKLLELQGDEEQPQAPSKAAAHQRRYRERHKPSEGASADRNDVTSLFAAK